MKKENKDSAKQFDREDEREIELQLHRYKFTYKLRNGKEPAEKLVQKEREKIIKRLFADDKTGLHQSEKEDGQIKCLLSLLRNEEKHLSIEEMSQALVNSGYVVGSSVKTIYRRLLPDLMNYGAVKDDSGKYYIPSYKRNSEFEKKLEMNMTEKIEVISMLSNFLETLKDSPVYQKAKDYIDSEFRSYRRRQTHEADRNLDLNSLASRIIFMGAPAASIQKGIWELLNEAMKQNKYVQIMYQGEKKTNPEKYTVQPYQLIFDNGFWDLWGYCTSSDPKKRRLFNLSRISDVKIIESEPFILPENYDFRTTLAGNFGCYNDDTVENYSIKIKKDSYAWLYIKDRIWGEFQEIKEEEDFCILEFEATQYPPILRWVLSWGPDVEPLEPERLVTEWKEKVREMGKSAR